MWVWTSILKKVLNSQKIIFWVSISGGQKIESSKYDTCMLEFNLNK
jgi:hypothetical protein